MRELVFPSCPYCRNLRIAMGIAAIIVIGAYVAILVSMNKPKEVS